MGTDRVYSKVVNNCFSCPNIDHSIIRGYTCMISMAALEVGERGIVEIPDTCPLPVKEGV